jgi:hypothetical protein
MIFHEFEEIREVPMKSIQAVCAVSILISAFASSESFGDYNSLAKNGPVTCNTRGITVTINKERTSFTITQTREPAVFNVIGEPEGDQDTFESFTGQLQMDHQKDEAILTFSDQGDTLEIGGKTRSLNCRE